MKYLDTFAGIGGFALGIERAHERVFGTKAECVGYSEIDRYAISIYEKHFREHKNYGNITEIDTAKLPDFDILVGGFPCQAFSIAGKRGGFEDTRGTLFFELARILADKKPGYFCFENVKGLLSHDRGRTFKTIIATLDELGYDLQWQVLNSKHFGVPQNRERIFIIGNLRDRPRPQVFPMGSEQETVTNDIKVAGTLDEGGWEKRHESIRRVYDPDGLAPTIPTGTGGGVMPKILIPEATAKGYAEATIGDSVNLSQITSKTRRGRVGKGVANTLETNMQQYVVTENTQHKIAVPVLTPDREKKRQNGRRMKENGDPSFTLTAQDRHGVYDGASVRRLTPLECERLQAFPDHWTLHGKDGEQISDTQRYKTLGNAVTVNVIEDIFVKFFKSISETHNDRHD